MSEEKKKEKVFILLEVQVEPDENTEECVMHIKNELGARMLSQKEVPINIIAYSNENLLDQINRGNAFKEYLEGHTALLKEGIDMFNTKRTQLPSSLGTDFSLTYVKPSEIEEIKYWKVMLKLIIVMV